MKKRVLDLYCGAGGFSHGFQDAGYEILAGIDNWKGCEETFIHNHDGAKFFLEDILLLKPEEIYSWVGDIDIVLGSPPCVDFSTVNPAREQDKGLEHIKQFIEIIDYLKPKYWIMENTHYAEKYIREVVSRRVRSVRLNAADFGVPQIRKRIFFGKFKTPEATHSKNPSQQTLFGQLKAWVTLGEVLDREVSYGYLTDRQTETAVRLKTRRETTQGSKITPIPFPDRLDRPSRTIMASIAMSNRSTIIVDPDGIPRTITLGERARIQGFRPSFKWFGADTNVKKMIGNAVPPPVAYAFAQAILE